MDRRGAVLFDAAGTLIELREPVRISRALEESELGERASVQEASLQ